MHMLYIASQSASRHQLLADAHIPFHAIEHYADEKACSREGSVHDIVCNIAHRKMEHVQMPHGEDRVVFVLTADTLSVDADGQIRSKPRDYDDAVAMIRSARHGSTVSTGFCLRKYVHEDGAWHSVDEHAGVVSADIVINIPDAWIDAYLEHQPYAMQANGAIAVEGYGSQFLEHIHGSYTAVIGLPMPQLRTALSDLGFYAAV